MYIYICTYISPIYIYISYISISASWPFSLPLGRKKRVTVFLLSFDLFQGCGHHLSDILPIPAFGRWGRVGVGHRKVVLLLVQKFRRENHLLSMKPYEKWNILHINWYRISSINSRSSPNKNLGDVCESHGAKVLLRAKILLFSKLF